MNKFLQAIVSGVFILHMVPSITFAQTTSRTYANFQGVYRTGLFAVGLETVFGQISDGAKAVDGDVRTASNPNIPAGLVGLASVTQYLGFTTNGNLNTARQIQANTPVAIKLSLPQSVIGLADNIEVGVYSGLQPVSVDINGFLGTGTGNASGHKATSTTTLYRGTALINALNGAGEVELVLTPTHSYEGVFIKLSGDVLSVALSMQIFHAYITESNAVGCSIQGAAIDVLSGTRGNSTINLLSATGRVNDPWSAVDDGSASLNTYATISAGTQVLSEAFETVIFNTAARTGDSLQLLIEDPGAQLLDLNLLGGLRITPYNGSIAGSIMGSTQAGLSLRLLSSSARKYMLTIPVSSAFDRVDISLGGVASVLSQLRVYDVKRIIPVPVVNGNTGSRFADTITVYKGSSLQLNTTSSDPVSWHTSGGSLLANGSTYSIPSVQTSATYIAIATRNGCTQLTSQYSIYVKVLEHTSLPVRDLILTGAKAADRITIKWTAKGEYAVSHYILQKKEADHGFADIAMIMATGDHTDINYLFADKSPVPGSNVYRLVMHEQSGAVQYSQTIQVLWDDQAGPLKVKVYPNPAKRNGKIYLEGLGKGEYLLSVLGTGGQVYSQASIRVNSNSGSVAFATGDLLPGLYWLKVSGTEGAGTSMNITRAFWIR
jgi:hypothetical protein